MTRMLTGTVDTTWRTASQTEGSTAGSVSSMLRRTAGQRGAAWATTSPGVNSHRAHTSWKKAPRTCRAASNTLVHAAWHHFFSLHTSELLTFSTWAVLCLLYFQNFPESTSSDSFCSRAVVSVGCTRDRSLFTPKREQVSIRTYLASLSSAVTLL